MVGETAVELVDRFNNADNSRFDQEGNSQNGMGMEAGITVYLGVEAGICIGIVDDNGFGMVSHPASNALTRFKANGGHVLEEWSHKLADENNITTGGLNKTNRERFHIETTAHGVGQLQNDGVQVEGRGKGVSDVVNGGEFDLLPIRAVTEGGAIQVNGEMASQVFDILLVDGAVLVRVYETHDRGWRVGVAVGWIGQGHEEEMVVGETPQFTLDDFMGRLCQFAKARGRSVVHHPGKRRFFIFPTSLLQTTIGMAYPNIKIRLDGIANADNRGGPTKLSHLAGNGGTNPMGIKCTA